MSDSISRIMVSTGAIAILLLLSPAASADTFETCTGTITALPAVITTQGTWCLANDLATGVTSGDAVTIATNNVTIDCNGYKLGGLSAGTGTLTIGIHATGRANATVRGCSIRGFHQGVLFEGAGGGHAVEDNRFDGNTWVAVAVEGDGSLVQRNRIADTGGSTVSGSPVGIRTLYSVDILDNTIRDVFATAVGDGGAYGIVTSDNPDGQIARNRVRRILKYDTGVAFGIRNDTAGRISLRDNEVIGDGSAGSTGLFCDTGSQAITLDNLISRFDVANTDCNDDGGNVVMP